MKKGFTLVELLAVIVILAVVLVIAVPQILDTTNKSRESVFTATVKMIASAAEKKLIENEIFEIEEDIECEDIVKINDDDYEDCQITFEGQRAYITLIGSGKFNDIAVVNATKDNIEIISADIARFIPKNAVEVNNEEELVEAINNVTEENPNILLMAPISVTSTKTITGKKVSLYSRNHNNKLSTSKNNISIFSVGNGATLEMYNISINQNGSWYFDSNNVLVINNADTRQTTSLIKVTAGGKLIFGKNMDISNVSSKTELINVQGSSTNIATAIIADTKISNCTTTTGTVNAAGYADVYLNEGTKIINNVAYNNSNHGILRAYNYSNVTIDGANISNNYYSGNGMLGFYKSNLTMNSGMISNNTVVDRTLTNIDNVTSTNGRYGLIYVHSASNFIMNGGSITNNRLMGQGAIDSIKTNSKVTLVSGTITNNIVTKNGETFDFPISTIYNDINRFELSEGFNITGKVYDSTTSTYIDIN